MEIIIAGDEKITAKSAVVLIRFGELPENTKKDEEGFLSELILASGILIDDVRVGKTKMWGVPIWNSSKEPANEQLISPDSLTTKIHFAVQFNTITYAHVLGGWPLDELPLYAMDNHQYNEYETPGFILQWEHLSIKKNDAIRLRRSFLKNNPCRRPAHRPNKINKIIAEYQRRKADSELCGDWDSETSSLHLWSQKNDCEVTLKHIRHKVIKKALYDLNYSDQQETHKVATARQ